MKIAVILFAVLGLAIYDYLHDKTIFKQAKAWVKYAVAFGVGLAYTAITALPFFQWLTIAGVVVIGGIFWSFIVNILQGLYDKLFKKGSSTAPPKA